MEQTEALSILSALAQATRLKVVDMLAHVGERGMASGDIADAVGVPRHLMSSHLAVLNRAGVVVARKKGRGVVYSISRTQISKISEYLQTVAAMVADEDAAKPTT